jgi:hypothetical protein
MPECAKAVRAPLPPPDTIYRALAGAKRDRERLLLDNFLSSPRDSPIFEPKVVDKDGGHGMSDGEPERDAVEIEPIPTLAGDEPAADPVDVEQTAGSQTWMGAKGADACKVPGATIGSDTLHPSTTIGDGATSLAANVDRADALPAETHAIPQTTEPLPNAMPISAPEAIAATIERYAELASNAATQYMFATRVISELWPMLQASSSTGVAAPSPFTSAPPAPCMMPGLAAPMANPAGAIPAGFLSPGVLPPGIHPAVTSPAIFDAPGAVLPNGLTLPPCVATAPCTMMPGTMPLS